MSTVPRMKRQGGFTIVELMIATAVFSILIVVITAAILQFTKQYYRGVIANRTQTTARNIMDDLTRSIQFNGGQVYELSDNNGYCIGDTKRYSVARNRQVRTTGAVAARHQAAHGLVSDKVTVCNTSTSSLGVATLPPALPTANNARELLGENMRVTKFTITSSGGFYVINLRVVYGDDDFLTTVADPNPNPTCKSTSGSHFCAVAELTSTVKKRVK